MFKDIVRMTLRMLLGVAVGMVLAALYATLVGGVHVFVHSRLDRVPGFVFTCISSGALLGFIAGAIWASSVLLRTRRPLAPKTLPALLTRDDRAA